MPDDFPPRVEALGEEGRVQAKLRDLFLRMKASPSGRPRSATGRFSRRRGRGSGSSRCPRSWSGATWSSRTPRSAAAPVELIPDAWQGVMHGTARLPSFEDPEAFGRLLAEFLGGGRHDLRAVMLLALVNARDRPPAP